MHLKFLEMLNTAERSPFFCRDRRCSRVNADWACETITSSPIMLKQTMYIEVVFINNTMPVIAGLVCIAEHSTCSLGASIIVRATIIYELCIICLT